MNTSALTIIAAAIAVLVWSSAVRAANKQAYDSGGPLRPCWRRLCLQPNNSRQREVLAGPTSQWLPQANQDGNLIFSGSEVLASLDAARIFAELGWQTSDAR